MPGIILFNRRWGIGSDDLVFPGIAEIIFRFLWLIAVCAVYQVHKNSFTCEKGLYLQTFYIGLITLTAATILVTTFIVVTSTRGTISNHGPRKWVSRLLYVKVFFNFVLELIFIILGTYWAFGDTSTCQREVVWTMRAAVLTGWFVTVVVSVGVFIVFDPLGGKRDRAATEREFHKATKLWEHRCRILCCCIGRDDHSKSTLTEIAQMIADFFMIPGIDLVATDIAAGLILIQVEQEKLRAVISSIGQDQEPRDTEQPDGATQGVVAVKDEKWLSLSQITYYMKFALAVYGWPLYLFSNLCKCGPCKLWGNMRCCAGCCGVQIGGAVNDDNCCECNMAAIKKVIGNNNCDIIYASFHNKIFEIPFFVAIDHQRKAVVVAIRGTLSLKDALTDMTAESEEMHIDDLPDADTHAHKGILQAAKFVSSRLENLKLLEDAFQQYKDYNLVITGHSLGAGAAACLSLLLQPKYPDLLCYAFSPPGGLLSPPLARYTQSFVCSVVLGKDLVPRLSLPGMEDLKIKVLQQIKDTSKPKYRILASGLWYFLCGLPKAGDDNSPEQPLLNGSGSRHYSSSQEIPDNDGNISIKIDVSDSVPLDEDCPDGEAMSVEIDGSPQAIVEWILDGLIDNAILNSRHKQNTYKVLHPPGKILHIIEDDDNKYISMWRKAEDFSNIIVNPKMLTDHLPDKVYEALQDLCKMDLVPQYSQEVV